MNPVIHPPDNRLFRAGDRHPVFADGAAAITGARHAQLHVAAVAAIVTPVAVGDHIIHVALGGQCKRRVHRQRRQAIVDARLIDVGQNLLRRRLAVGCAVILCVKGCDKEKCDEQGE